MQITNIPFDSDELNEIRKILDLRPNEAITGKVILKALDVARDERTLSLSRSSERPSRSILVRDMERRAAAASQTKK